MPTAFRYQLIIAADADKAGVEAAVQVDLPSFSLAVPLYTAADATPRTASHWWTAFKHAPFPSIETPVTGCKDVFPNSYFEEYFVPVNGGYPQTRLTALGLTTSATI